MTFEFDIIKDKDKDDIKQNKMDTFEFENIDEKKKGRIIDMNELDKNRRVREKEKFKDEISEDIDDVLSKVMDKFENKFKDNKDKKDKTPKGKVIKFLKILGLLGLGILVLNFILFNVWLLKYFVKSLFIGG